MFKSKFTLKIVLLSILPILLFSFFSFLLLSQKIEQLSDNTSKISGDALSTIYRQIIENKSEDITAKIELKFNTLLNELNTLRGGAQQLIDGEKMSSDPYASNTFVHDAHHNWSNIEKSDIDVSISVWGYLHERNGTIQKQTRDYIGLMSPIKPLLHTMGKYGVDKTWFYVVGPKSMPVIFLTPWVKIEETFEKLYPGHNEHNWWDFFFPGIIEGWNGWIADESFDIHDVKNQIVMTPVYHDAAGKGLMISIFAPLWNPQRTQNYGSAGADYTIENIVNMIKNEKITNNGFSFLLQNNGDVIGADDKIVSALALSQNRSNAAGVTIHNFNLKNSRIAELSTIGRDLHSVKKFSLYEFKDGENKEFFLSIQTLMNYHVWDSDNKKITKGSLYVAIVIPKEEILEAQYKIAHEIERLSSETLLFLVIVSGVFAVITIMVALYYALQNTQQIQKMYDAALEVGNKNYNVSIDIVAKDEIGSLAKSFNTMIADVKNAYTKLENYAHDLEAKVYERTVHLEEANRKLEILSQIDGLTQVYNRRYFDTKLQEIWNEYRRVQQPISILMIDVDLFKKYNDCYGHQAGDACLRSVASTLKYELKRSNDVIARYGGEEFVIICCCNHVDALKLAEKMGEAIRKLSLEHIASEKNIVTISIGVASMIPSKEKDPLTLIQEADSALYESKKLGRDTVCGSTSLDHYSHS